MLANKPVGDAFAAAVIESSVPQALLSPGQSARDSRRLGKSHRRLYLLRLSGGKAR